MKLAISNIGCAEENDDDMYALMKGCGFTGLEIAPTRIFPENPYDDLNRAKEWSYELKQKMDLSYHLCNQSGMDGQKKYSEVTMNAQS